MHVSCCCVSPLYTLQESLSSAGTPQNRDSLTYSTWLEDSISSTSTTSRGNSPGETGGEAGPANFVIFFKLFNTSHKVCLKKRLNVTAVLMWICFFKSIYLMIFGNTLKTFRRLMIYWCITNACNDSWWLMHEWMQGCIINSSWSPLKNN